jgi:tRNA 2-thiouridine synthesizing protein A
MIYQVDARKVLCPLPVIRTQNKIKELTTGDVLEVTCTDPGAIHDIPAWCRIHGHQVLDIIQKGHEILICVQIG